MDASASDVGDNEIRILNRIVRVTDRGLEYEADPRHVDLIAESLEITNGKPASSPGIKNPDASIECETKENEPAVIELPSETSATKQVEAGCPAALLKSFDGPKPEPSVDGGTVNYISGSKSDGADNGPENILDLLCALTSDNSLFGDYSSSKSAASVKAAGVKVAKVRFNDDANTCSNITPYSEIYGFLPSTMVPTAAGWKPVSMRSCHFSGKSADVIKARLAVIANKRD